MKAIKDSVHGHVRLGDLATDLVDTPAFQRLRHIKQLSTVRLVYPSANHTRFEHSLGVYHLARRAVEGFDLDADTAAHVRAAALLHDVGHGPYGHQTEGIIRRATGRDHDDVAWLLTDADREVCRVLERNGLDPERVAALIDGEGALGPLVSGELDVDRMDYLVRDAHHTGVPYGTVDTGRLVTELRLIGGDGPGESADLVLAEGNVATAESLLVARSLMNAVVYRHHVSRVAGAMLERACERYLDRTGTELGAFRRMADHDLLVELRDRVPALGERIERRDLYKRAVWAGIDEVPAGTVDAGRAEERAAEREIADAVGIDRDAVIVDIPSRPALKESGSAVVVDGVPQRLEDASELVAGLRAAERRRWTLGVYCPAERVEPVADAARDVLGLRAAGRPSA
ncbi:MULTISPECIES: HD domain-containing protein [Halorubrum]|uniref:Phosphohydrolase n=1 Tax=Halorubrum tropicale TaxID=1765655 RepID=A0A0M9AQE3_9EURY|nr:MULTISPECIES: HD domain-containing protein [Halorubrum]KOX95595.1 phosphohydrolase [Halorubrum tropicale]TKX45092.1 HD domain-containing protein [Halorubrum sp. ARQ200]TKX49427.1 HD domain-containing protein [Halorubrum sp. ASP121]TKX57587.1 HD domain-containing protein [Halorubrum sp. ASP1]